MSVKAMGEVWDADLPRNEKYVLLAYADHAAHDGTSIYPSINRIAWKTGYSRRSVQYITNKLQSQGILADDGKGPLGTNRWRLVYEKLPTRSEYRGGATIAPPPNGEGVQNLHGGVQNLHGGVQKTTEGGAESAPEPSCNHHIEPSPTESPPPTSYQEWLTSVQESKNRTATLRWMIAVLYPYYREEDLPSYGHIGKVARKVGGAGNLANWIWRCAEHEPKGNLMSYIQKAASGGRNGRRQADRAAGAKGGTQGSRLKDPTDEEALKTKQDLARHHIKLGQLDSPYIRFLTKEEREELGVKIPPRKRYSIVDSL